MTQLFTLGAQSPSGRLCDEHFQESSISREFLIMAKAYLVFGQISFGGPDGARFWEETRRAPWKEGSGANLMEIGSLSNNLVIQQPQMWPWNLVGQSLTPIGVPNINLDGLGVLTNRGDQNNWPENLQCFQNSLLGCMNSKWLWIADLD